MVACDSTSVPVVGFCCCIDKGGGDGGRLDESDCCPSCCPKETGLKYLLMFAEPDEELERLCAFLEDNDFLGGTEIGVLVGVEGGGG